MYNIFKLWYYCLGLKHKGTQKSECTIEKSAGGCYERKK